MNSTFFSVGQRVAVANLCKAKLQGCETTQEKGKTKRYLLRGLLSWSGKHSNKENVIFDTNRTPQGQTKAGIEILICRKFLNQR